MAFSYNNTIENTTVGEESEKPDSQHKAQQTLEIELFFYVMTLHYNSVDIMGIMLFLSTVQVKISHDIFLFLDGFCY